MNKIKVNITIERRNTNFSRSVELNKNWIDSLLTRYFNYRYKKEIKELNKILTEAEEKERQWLEAEKGFKQFKVLNNR